MAEEVGDQHGLAEPGQPGDHDPRDLGQPDHDRLGVLSPAQPPGGQAGRGQAGQVDPSRRQQRIAVQAAQPNQARALLLGPDPDTAPGIGQVAGGALVVGQAGASDGADAGGHTLVVSDELGGREAVLTGPLIPIAQPQGLSQQRPLSGQPPRLLGVLSGGGLLGMETSLPSAQPAGEQAAKQGGDAADHGQQHGEADEGGKHPRRLP